MCSGEDKALDEGSMIPSCSMCSNTCLATLRRSGARRLGRAETGLDVVSDVMHDRVVGRTDFSESPTTG